MEPCVREVVEAADVVVVEVREDDVGDGRGIDIDGSESLGRGAQELRRRAAASAVPNPVSTTQVRMLPDDRPDEVVHRHRHVVRVAADEVLGPPSFTFRVLDRVHRCEPYSGPRHRA